jgi:uracil phosphoribosyltransferase
MKNFILVDNPIIKRIGLKLHNVATSSSEYRENTKLLGLYMGIDLAQRGVLPLKKSEVQTPLGEIGADIIDEEKVGIVNVLRAGTCMALGMGQAFPESSVAFISAWRKQNGSKITVESDYNHGVEDLAGKSVILTDPALASGFSLLACIEVIYKKVNVEKIIICALHSAKLGVINIHKKYPEVEIYSVFGLGDLNKKFYIINGPGDCGDRCFNTT